jgi:hypothetical protein
LAHKQPNIQPWNTIDRKLVPPKNPDGINGHPHGILKGSRGRADL